MRRLTAWIGGTAAAIAAYRLWRRRPQPTPEPTLPAEPESDARAEELREKLAESRTADPETEPVAEEPRAPEPEPESPEERRRQVHEEGRAALDQMKSDESG